MNTVSMVTRRCLFAILFLIVALFQSANAGQPIVSGRYPPNGRADYVIITAPAYLTPLQQLAELRGSLSGLTAAIALTDSIYQWFGTALPPDSAIRAFIEFAETNWGSPKPKFFVLGGNVNVVPSHKEPGLTIPGSIQEDSIMVDYWYAEATANPDSGGRPRAAIGRLPGWNPEEMQSIVDKIIAYEHAPAQPWQAQSIGVADYNDSALSVFEYDIRSRQGVLSSVWPDTINVFVRIDAPEHRDPQQFREILDQGAALLMFSGEANSRQFSESAYFTSSDVDSLTNTDRLPFCDGLANQRFEKSDTPAIAVRLMTIPHAGAVAVLCVSGITYFSYLSEFSSFVCMGLAQSPARTIGAIFLQSMAEFSGGSMLLCRRETLLGDPAMVVRNPLLASTQSGPTEVVHRFYLSQNYPNPFNPSTQIRYQISESGRVTLTVFDLLGREVRTLVDEQKQPGTYTVTFDGSGLASGVYFYRLQAGSFTTTRKLVLLR